MKLSSFFDRIFVLNLISRKDRKEMMLKQFHDLGMDDDEKIEFIEAVQLPCITNDIVKDMYDRGVGEFYSYSSHEHSRGLCMCSFEHFNVVKRAYERGYERILVLEDDARFIKNINAIYKALENMPKKFDILHIEGFYCPVEGDGPTREECLNVLSPTIEEAEWVNSFKLQMYGAAALIYSREGMEKYIFNQENHMTFSDNYTYLMNADSYFYSYPLVIQDGGYSDINKQSYDTFSYNIYTTYAKKEEYFHYEVKKKVEIVYIATNGYCDFFKNFLKSVKYFMPNCEKDIVILSNGLKEYDGYSDEYIRKVKVREIFDLYYPCINLHKSYLINQMNHSEYDYIFYFDADTVFIENENYDWNRLLDKLDNNEVLISRHPIYALKDNMDIYNLKGEKLNPYVKEDYIKNFFTANMTEKNETKAAYIPDVEYTYVITSFFAANTATMKKFNDEVSKLVRRDLCRATRYHIPQFMDENYINRMVYEYEFENNDNIRFSVEQYSKLYGIDDKQDEYDTIFMYQKNMKGDKTNRQ